MNQIFETNLWGFKKYQLQGELSRIYQKNEKDIITYANWVKILGKQIMKVHKISGNVLSNQSIINNKLYNHHL